ncbi:MAG: TRAP transporter substrate-binding protein [Myxococcales bacterium]|nr:TRAP transporter substrate-binding protein [Myxococcales bacterium]
MILRILAFGTVLMTTMFAVNPTSSAAADQAKKKKARYKIKFGTMAPSGTPWEEALKLWSEAVEKRTNGDIDVQLFLAGALGGELQMVEGVQFGTIEAGGFSTGAVSSFIPELDLFELPFMWDSSEECYYVLDHALFKAFEPRFEAKGFKMLAWSENGWRNFFTKTKAIHTPADLKGLKMRSQENRVHQAFWRALGANAVPISTPEVYTALQQGTVDGGENSMVLTAATGWFEVIKYISISRHIYQPAVIVFNKRFWDRLPEGYRQILQEEGAKITFDTRKVLADAEPEFIAGFKEDGIQINELTPEERAQFIEATKGVKGQFESVIGKDLLDLVQKTKAEYLASKTAAAAKEATP